jgi:serine phosphatase RsbU (regulator of sigma subunit)
MAIVNRMRPTIENRVVGGFSAVLFLMVIAAAIGTYSVLSLRSSALETARVGDRLSSISLEIQVHNLEAQRKTKSYLAKSRQLGAGKARETYLDEAEFEIHEIESLAAREVRIAPSEEKRAKFHLVSAAAVAYASALEALVQGVEKGAVDNGNAVAAYEASAEHLNETAEDGEMAGREASQSSQENIERVSKRSVPLVIGVSLLELVTALGMSFIINQLHQQLKRENARMSSELEITQRLQQMMLPRDEEMRKVAGLDISCFMEPAAEVGGDYYDVVCKDGGVVFGIGDVTGHGLESGVIAIMVQTAVRTLLASGQYESKKFFDTLNRVIYDNVRRMQCDRNLTFSLLHYQDKVVTISGQHEEVLVIRGDGVLERHDTLDLGFPLGLEEDISSFIGEATVPLLSGDVMVAYTDGITEAMNCAGVAFGVERLSEAVRTNHGQPADAIRQGVLSSLREYIGGQHLLDDVSLLVIKPG